LRLAHSSVFFFVWTLQPPPPLLAMNSRQQCRLTLSMGIIVAPIAPRKSCPSLDSSFDCPTTVTPASCSHTTSSSLEVTPYPKDCLFSFLLAFLMVDLYKWVFAFSPLPKFQTSPFPYCFPTFSAIPLSFSACPIRVSLVPQFRPPPPPPPESII